MDFTKFLNQDQYSEISTLNTLENNSLSELLSKEFIEEQIGNNFKNGNSFYGAILIEFLIFRLDPLNLIKPYNNSLMYWNYANFCISFWRDLYFKDTAYLQEINNKLIDKKVNRIFEEIIIVYLIRAIRINKNNFNEQIFSNIYHALGTGLKNLYSLTSDFRLLRYAIDSYEKTSDKHKAVDCQDILKSKFGEYSENTLGLPIEEFNLFRTPNNGFLHTLIDIDLKNPAYSKEEMKEIYFSNLEIENDIIYVAIENYYLK